MGFTVFSDKKLGRTINRLARRLIRQLEKTTPIHHRVAIVLYNSPTLAVFKTKQGFRFGLGNFARPSKLSDDDRKNWDCVINVAARSHALYGDRFDVLTTIVHEVCHYRQFRDKKKSTEKDINQATCNLYQQVYRKWGRRNAMSFCRAVWRMRLVKISPERRIKLYNGE